MAKKMERFGDVEYKPLLDDLKRSCSNKMSTSDEDSVENLSSKSLEQYESEEWENEADTYFCQLMKEQVKEHKFSPSCIPFLLHPLTHREERLKLRLDHEYSTDPEKMIKVCQCFKEFGYDVDVYWNLLTHGAIIIDGEGRPIPDGLLSAEEMYIFPCKDKSLSPCVNHYHFKRKPLKISSRKMCCLY